MVPSHWLAHSRLELQDGGRKVSVVPPVLREPVQPEGAHSRQARHSRGHAAVRHLPEADAQPIVPARAHVPPPQAGSLPRAAQHAGRTHEASVTSHTQTHARAHKTI